MDRPTLLVPGNLAGAAGRAPPGPAPTLSTTAGPGARWPEFGGGRPTVPANRVFIVRSETGSGKSTVLPAQIFRLLRSEKTRGAVRLIGPGVICTQPRILTAQTIARDQAADEKNYPDLVRGSRSATRPAP